MIPNCWLILPERLFSLCLTESLVLVFEVEPIHYLYCHFCSRNLHHSIYAHSDMYDLTAFQRDLLYTIAGQDEPHGLAIKQELEQYYEGEIHHGRLYPNLDEIVDKGLVEKGELDRRTNYYTITARGPVNSKPVASGKTST